jgi:ribosomal protein L32
MKIKQRIETSGKFVEPDIKRLLMPEIVVCPECGNLIYPYEYDKDKVYYFPNMSTERRYYTKHYARATFTCQGCGCKFSRTANTYTKFNWGKINLDWAKVLMVLSGITLFVGLLNAMIYDIHFDIIQLLVIISSVSIFLGSVIYYWRNK